MSQSGLSGSGDTAGNITDLIGQCQDGYEVQLRELDRQIEDEERRIQKIEAEDRACKARTAQKEQILISIRNEKQDVLKATGEIQLELKELAEMKESLQLCLKSQEDAIGLVRIRIEFITTYSKIGPQPAEPAFSCPLVRRGSAGIFN